MREKIKDFAEGYFEDAWNALFFVITAPFVIVIALFFLPFYLIGKLGKILSKIEEDA